jgi:hypothetical protein
MKIGTEHLRQWAKISREWRIQMLNTHTETRAGTRYQTLWFNAVCEETKACRRYRVWFNESLSPPYRKQQGWELFDDEGSVCDREIRYSRRNDSNYLH